MSDPKHVQFEAAFDKANFFKGNADGSGTLILSVPASEAQHLMRVWQEFREQHIIVTIVVKGDVLGRRAD